MELFVVALLIGLLPATIAHKKGRSFGVWWLYGSLLFIVALPHALVLEWQPDHSGAISDRLGKKKCPFCAEMIQLEAVVCRHCGRDLPADSLEGSETLHDQLVSLDDKALVALHFKGRAAYPDGDVWAAIDAEYRRRQRESRT